MIERLDNLEFRSFVPPATTSPAPSGLVAFSSITFDDAVPCPCFFVDIIILEDLKCYIPAGYKLVIADQMIIFC